MSTWTVLLLGFFLLSTVFFCTVELCVLLVHRLRLQVLEDSGDRRARLVNRILEKQDLAATSANVGVQLSIAGAAATFWWGATELELGAGEKVVALVIAFPLLFLLMAIVPRVVVPSRPTRWLLTLSYPFTVACWTFYPVSRVLRALRGTPPSSTTDSSHLAKHPSLVLREDLRELISRPELEILGEREAEMALKLFRFGGALVRELMTPSDRVVALPIDATVGELFAEVRKAGFTRIPVYRGSKDRLVGLINVHDVLETPTHKTLEKFVRQAPEVAPKSSAYSLFVHLQRNPNWMAFVMDGEKCEGIVTVEDLVEEILGEIYDEFELPRPRYVPAGKRRLRANASLSVRELGHDLRLGKDDREDSGLADATIADAVERQLGRPPAVGDSVVLDGLRVQVTKVSEDRAVEVEVSRSGGPGPAEES